MKKFLKNTPLALLLGTAVLTADSSLYVGLDYGISDNMFEVTNNTTRVVTKTDLAGKGIRLKLGTASETGIRAQLYYARESYERPPFDATHDILNEIGGDAMMAFDVTPEVWPFLKAGLGFSWMHVDQNIYADGQISGVHLKGGAGILFRLKETIELETGLDVQGRAWQSITSGTTTRDISESTSKLYVGMNLLF